MNKLVLLLVLLASTSFADGVFTRSVTKASAGAGGSATPGGSDTQVQYNSGGAFAGDSGLTYGSVSRTLNVGGNLNLFDRALVRPQLTTSIRVSYDSPTTAAQFQVGVSSTSGGGFTVWPATASACIGWNCSSGLGTPSLGMGIFNVSVSETRISGLNSRMSVGYLLPSVSPSVTLDVNGNISATNIRSFGDVTSTRVAATNIAVSDSGVIGICTTSVVCNAARRGYQCFSLTKNLPVFCNGADSWIQTVSTTLVSASAL